MSWIPTTAPLAITSRVASSRSFSVNGSPTWTLGRFASLASEISSEAKVAPWMPSRPVALPRCRRGCPPGRDRARRVADLDHADAHRVDERVALVRRVEVDLARDGRHAEGVSVVADPAHDAVEEVAHAGAVERPEPERVERADRPRAHREDVPLDAADAGGRALVRLDGGRVVVALDLERDGQPVADVHEPGVLLAGLHEQAPPSRGRVLSSGDGVLVRAVLAPHHRVDAEFDDGRGPAEFLDDPAVLFVGEAVLAGEFEGDFRFANFGLGHGGGLDEAEGTAAKKYAGPARPVVNYRTSTTRCSRTVSPAVARTV
jgi:hypothetical protein